jgi:hypothetical protein
MRHDQVQIVSVPSGNPMIGQTPSFVFSQCRSLDLTAVTARLKPRPFKAKSKSNRAKSIEQH